MRQKYVRLFETFEESDDMIQSDPIGGTEHTKSWMLSTQELDSKVAELRQVMDEMDEIKKMIAELEKELNVSGLKQHEERLVSDIKLAMESINKSNHKVHGLVLKHRKGTLRWNPPSQKLMLEIIELELEGGKELIEKLKTESAFKQPVDVRSSLSVKREGDIDITEAEDMSKEKPWYKRAFEQITDWLSSFRRKVIDTSVKLEDLVNQFENTLESAKSQDEIYKERENEILKRKTMSRGMY